MLESIRPFLHEHISGPLSGATINLVLLAGIAVVSVLAYHLCKLLLNGLERLILQTPTEWDDDMLDGRMMKAVSQLAPALLVKWLIPGLFGDTAESMHWLEALTSLYILWAIIRILTLLTGNLYLAFLKRPHLKIYAVKGIFQMIKLIFIGFGVIIGLSILIGKSPTVILAALGASAAVLMLVFQDTILGLVASIQLTANNMLRRGDWIETKSNDVNGEVIEVSLTAVKVKNWDNSVTTIPPYTLIKSSFRNYQPMRNSGGRRVARSIYIDVNSIRFLDSEELGELQAKGWLEGIDVADAGKVVNLQLLRKYLASYLANHPQVNHSMTTIVRQLDPTPSGLPLELYFFVSNVDWTPFEGIASDIFDHVYAIVGEFGLSMFQVPAGTDIARLK
ncbi:MAG: mechanosensitive ion channel [Bacteroidales bacterium]|nr:mechanosensitive ion channel [Bacteroidales bacterium]